MFEFVGRRAELERMAFCEGQGRAILIYGRRRIGKTTLIDEFCKGKNALRITCMDSTLRVNLSYIADEVSAYTGRPYAIRKLLDLRSCLEDVGKSNAVIVIDEYQYLQKASRNASDTMLQQFIDTSLKCTGSTLILCGSAVSIMKRTGEDGKKPLYGRFAEIIHLGPLSFQECMVLHPDMPRDDAMRLYLTVGGIPKYHSDLHSNTYKGVFISKCLANGSWDEEAQFLMKADYSNSEGYDAIIAAIAKGNTALKTIAENAGIDTSACSKMLRELENNDAVERINPMMGAPKRGRYAIKDNFLAFRYEILLRRRTLLMQKDGDAAYLSVEHFLSTFFGSRFEFYCRDYILSYYPYTEVGKWWLDDPRRNIHMDIDIVAKLLVGESNVDLFAECKFTSSKVGFHVYNTLESRVERFKRDTNWRLMLMSWAGFEDELSEFAGPEGVMLIGPDELTGESPPPAVRLRCATHRIDEIGVHHIVRAGQVPSRCSSPF